MRGPGHIPLVKRHEDVGLLARSLARSKKVATIDAGLAHHLGRVPDSVPAKVKAPLRRHLALHIAEE